MNRRKFLGVTGAGLGVAGLNSLGQRRVASAAPWAPQQPTGGLPAQEETDWQEIDRLHKEQVDKFLANIGTDDLFWNRQLEYTVADDGYKEFNIVMQEVEWETDPELVYPAFAYNGIVPGPEIRVTEGDNVRVFVKNEMNESSGIHWHG